MYRYRKKIVFSLLFALLCITAGACKKPVDNEKVAPATPELNPIEAKLKEKGEKLTKELARQKELKAAIPQMPEIEKFTRETNERQVLKTLGEPENTRDIKMENTQQRVYYYNKSKFAVWLWREKEDAGPYQYRATISLNHGRFDMPLHNVLTEDELRDMNSTIQEDQ